MNRLHRWIESRTGLVFGGFEVTGWTSHGAPLNNAWLAIYPRRDGWAFSISCKRRGFYLDYVPRHELAEAKEVA